MSLKDSTFSIHGSLQQWTLLREFEADIGTDFRAGDFATLTEYLNSDYWEEIRDLIIIHDGKYHHSRGGLGFGQTSSTSDKSYASTSFSLPFLRRVPSVLPIIHETGHLIGATQRDFEIDDGHHCTNDCIMTDDATINYMEWEEIAETKVDGTKTCSVLCITQIEAKKQPNHTAQLHQSHGQRLDRFPYMGDSTNILNLRPAGNPPKKTPGGKTIPKRYLKGSPRKRWKLQSRKSTRATNTTLMIQKPTNTGSQTSKQQQEGTKPFQASTRRSSSRCTVHFQKKEVHRQDCEGNENQEKHLAESLRQRIGCLEVGHRPGVQQHQWAAGRVYSFVTLGNTVVKGKKKMSDYTLAVEAGIIKDGDLVKNNPLKVITSNIITISGRSGSGKSTIAKGIKKRLGRDARVVPSYMTRKKRK